MLTLDRTEWKFGKTPLNILVLGVIVGDISVPLLWHILPKAGCSNTEERLAIFDCFFVLAPPERINYLLADREFVGQEWFTFLQRAGIDFRIRIRKNFTVANRRGKLIPVYRLFASLPLNEGKTVVRPLKVCSCALWISGMRLPSGEYLIVVSPQYTRTAIEDYAKRWTIELLFGCLKSRGFNCEETHLTKPERIQTVMALLPLAFFWAY
ncbi:MAG: IS4 family transposase, partial [Gloeotrichia echinulata HAB0833]